MSSFKDTLQVQHSYQLVNIDTDSISFCKPDGTPFSPEERKAKLAELNSQFPKLIQYTDDGYYQSTIVIATKNYILHDPENPNPKKRLIIKGASLKASNKEIYLKDFIKSLINILLDPNFTQDQIIDLYNQTAKECLNLRDMSRHAFKKSITDKVINGERTDALKVKLAIKHEVGVQQGDKYRLFYLPDKMLCMDKNFKGVYCKKTLLKKLYNTMQIFEAVIPIELFTNYSLEKNYYPFVGEVKPKRTKAKLKGTNSEV